MMICFIFISLEQAHGIGESSREGATVRTSLIFLPLFVYKWQESYFSQQRSSSKDSEQEDEILIDISVLESLPLWWFQSKTS